MYVTLRMMLEKTVFTFRILILITFFSIAFLDSKAQGTKDSVGLSLEDADRLFLSKNFQLLAAKYEINASDAAIIQARLYPNPTLNLEQGDRKSTRLNSS